MTKADKKANKVTVKELALVLLLAAFLVFGFVFAFSSTAQGADIVVDNRPFVITDGVTVTVWGTPKAEVEVYRGNEVSVWSTPQYVEGVTVVRGYSNYPVYETRESETPAATTSSVDQWFKGYDQWRRRRIQEKIRPGHTGSSFGKP